MSVARALSPPAGTSALPVDRDLFRDAMARQGAAAYWTAPWWPSTAASPVGSHDLPVCEVLGVAEPGGTGGLLYFSRAHHELG